MRGGSRRYPGHSESHGVYFNRGPDVMQNATGLEFAPVVRRRVWETYQQERHRGPPTFRATEDVQQRLVEHHVKLVAVVSSSVRLLCFGK